MTLALAWLSGSDFGVIADSAVTRWQSEDVSGPTSLGQRDRFSEYSVNEEALKLYEIRPGLIFSAAGHALAIENAADALRSLTLANAPEAAVLRYQSEATAEYEFDGLLCYARNSISRIIGFRPSGHIQILQGSPGYLGVGSLRAAHSMIMTDFLNLLITQKLSITEEVSLIAGYIISQTVHEPLLADGIGGPIFSGVSRAGIWHWMQDTAFVLAHSSYFRAIPTGLQPSADLLDIIFSSVCNGVGLAFSTILSKDDDNQQTGIRLFRNKLSPPVKSWLEESAANALSAMWRPSRIVFISIDAPKTVGIITGINRGNSPISIARCSDGISISCTPQFCELLALNLSRPQNLFIKTDAVDG